MNTTIPLITKLLSRFRPPTTRIRVALAENLAAEINLYPGLPDRLLRMRASAPARRESELRQVAQRFRAKNASSEAADALCRLANPELFECAVPFLRGNERNAAEQRVADVLPSMTLAAGQLN